MAREKYLFVINPIAGGLDKNEYVAGLKHRFEKITASFDVIETTREDDTKKILDYMENCRPDTVVAVGGDGTCNLVAGLLRDKNLVLGIVPLGSANGLATELSIPADPGLATALLFEGKEMDIDAVLVNQQHLCIHLSDIGLNARVVKRFEREKSRGMMGYFRQYVTELLHMEAKKFSFEVNGNQFKRKAHMVVIANARKYGTGAIVNPLGKINDGKFEVCIVKPFPVWLFFALTISLFRGTLKGSRYVKIFSCKKIRVFNRNKETLQVDGEVIGEPAVVDAEILPKALRVIVPSSFKPGSSPAP